MNTAIRHTLRALDRSEVNSERARTSVPEIEDAVEPTHDEADVLEWLGKRQDPDGWIVDALADACDHRNTTKLADMLPEILKTRIGKRIFAYLEKNYVDQGSSAL